MNLISYSNTQDSLRKKQQPPMSSTVSSPSSGTSNSVPQQVQNFVSSVTATPPPATNTAQPTVQSLQHSSDLQTTEVGLFSFNTYFFLKFIFKILNQLLPPSRHLNKNIFPLIRPRLCVVDYYIEL